MPTAFKPLKPLVHRAPLARTPNMRRPVVTAMPPPPPARPALPPPPPVLAAPPPPSRGPQYAVVVEDGWRTLDSQIDEQLDGPQFDGHIGEPAQAAGPAALAPVAAEVARRPWPRESLESLFGARSPHEPELEDVSVAVPLALRTRTPLYALGIGLAVAVTSSCGAAFWMAFIHKPL